MTQRSRYLPEMNATTRVSAQTAMIDRVVLNIGRWFIIDTKSEIAACLSNLTSITLPQSNDGEIPMFVARTCLAEHTRHMLDLRSSGSGVNRLAEAPSLSGALIGYVQRLPRVMGRTGTVGEDAGSGGRANLRFHCGAVLQAHLNLTRWLQGQDLHRLVRIDRPRTPRVFRLTVGSRPDWYLGERPMCMDSNIIIGHSRRYAFAMSKPCEEHFRDYLNTIEGHISDGLDYHSNGQCEFHEEYRLGDIEYYWEFSHRNPIEFVNMLLFYMPLVARRMRVTRRQLGKISRVYHEQSICINVFLQKGIRVSVYAKTDRRVRFELCFPKGYQRDRSWRAPTFGTKTGLISRIAELKSIAADTMNLVLDNMWATIGGDPDRPTPLQLRHEISNAATDPFMATSIVMALALQRRVAPGIKDPMRPALIRLKKNGVLRYLAGDKSIFVVTPRYEYARRNLRSV